MNVPLLLYNFVVMTLVLGFSVYKVVVLSGEENMWGLVSCVCSISVYFNGVTLLRDWKRSKAR